MLVSEVDTDHNCWMNASFWNEKQKNKKQNKTNLDSKVRNFLNQQNMLSPEGKSVWIQARDFH